VVIVGGGQGGYQTAASLRTEGYDGPITIAGDETHAPYQRPPLSKAFILGKQDRERVLLRPESYYPDHQIEFLSGRKVARIDRAARQVVFEAGDRLKYDSLVLAVGARNRLLPIPGMDLDGVCYLRTLSEAVDLKQRLENAQSVVVIGGGFIGLEIAASARALGKPVTVVEALPRLMARVVAPVVSEFFLQAHTARGVEFRLGEQVEALLGSDGKVTEVKLRSGETLPADLVVAGIGIVPNVELAQTAGLTLGNGIRVNEFLETADERVFAIGDCAEYPSAFAGGVGTHVRLESVQNAVDQAVCVAKTITGKRAAYDATPWFWSDQFDLRLQMAGLPAGHDTAVVRGSIEQGKFSVFYFREGRVCAVDSINRPADHMASRKLIGGRGRLTPEQARDESVNLKSLSAAAEVT
jgi:3-phenylpropionate/trans-cinnamate dioxygenase ferredoxin reductase subunit